MLDRVGLELDPGTPVGDLPIATQQLIEIAKALRHQARVVVMDEPTSALNVQEAERLFELIANLKSSGVGIVYISHKMDEIERLADRISVLRDGLLVESADAADMPLDRLILLMLGSRNLRDFPSAVQGRSGGVMLQVSGLTFRRESRTVLKDIHLTVRQGEVVGLAGLEGSGNSSLLLSLFGSFGRCPGSLKIEGRPKTINSPIVAIRNGLALLTSDRKQSGLVLTMSVAANTTMAVLKRISAGGWIRRAREAAIAEEAVRDFNIRANSVDSIVGDLSGGNQQKVALAKWIQTEAKILMLDEPTRGIDIGAKREIYEMIAKWKAQGKAILLVTSELPELIAMSDRIVVMHRGEIVTEFDRAGAEAGRILQAAMNAA
jgi:ABC-type sugar transport system ATPase subunit